MSKVEQLITEHIDIWTSAILAKSTAGRGSNKKYELYGIKKLRELILELAVRGKLVPQDPSDEPASVLLERIATEKIKLIKEGKVKKSKPLPEIDEDEKPFELPQGWELVKFGEIYSLEYGNNLPQAKRSNTGEYNVYGSNGVVGSHNMRSVSSPCIVVGRKGSAGALNICFDDGCWVTDVAYSCIPPAGIDLEFSFIQLHTLGLDSLGKGIKPGLNRNEAYVINLGIPPLEEQQRIVAKVDELMLLCDQLEQQTETSIDAHVTLVEVLLATLTDSANANELAQNWARVSEHFATLFTTEQSIEALKQTLLQLAVMGKLVPQDPDDEPAAVLLEKIAAEKAQLIKDKKIKKEKPLPPIGDDEKPFELPQGWAWTRFGQLFRVTSGDGLSRNQMQDGDIPVFGGNGITGYHNDSNVDKPTVVIGRVGYYCGSVHLTPAKAWITDNAFFTIYDEDKLFQNFVVWLLKTINLQENTSATAQPVISGSKIYPILIPLPPFNEQYRIVAKINELMKICDQLKANLQQSQETQVQLTDALVDQALVQ